MSASPIPFPQQPRLWARPSLAGAAQTVHHRKGPHCLRLVQASAAGQVVWELPTAQRTIEPGLVYYRKYTEAMLRRYTTMSMEKGRVPSLLGREIFPANVTRYKVHAFDDVVNFVHDVDNCLAALTPGLRQLVRRIAVEGYTQEETASRLGISLRTVVTKYGDALDKLTRLFLQRKLLEPLMAHAEDAGE